MSKQELLTTIQEMKIDAEAQQAIEAILTKVTGDEVDEASKAQVNKILEEELDRKEEELGVYEQAYDTALDRDIEIAKAAQDADEKIKTIQDETEEEMRAIVEQAKAQVQSKGAVAV
ncbi:MAG: hypothetical protein AAB701_00255 [Patescibacteria group bacterium]